MPIPSAHQHRFAALIAAVAAVVLVSGSASPSAAASPGHASVVPAGGGFTAGAAPAQAPAPSFARATARSPAEAPARVVSVSPCPESRFTCVTLAVPRDHFAVGGSSWNVTFAILRATGVRRGVFVTITGGPGTSGISVADGYTDAFDSAIPEHFDIVFLDQRGVGMSRPIQCPAAAATYYASPLQPQDPSQREAVGQAAHAFADDCVAESNVDPSDLPFYATRQAVEDLEAFRTYLGADQLHLYGESYGTQYVQTYAAAHPERVAALFVDGPVDLTIDGPRYYMEAARAFSDALTATFLACGRDDGCAADTAGGNAAKAYDRLARRFASGQASFRFPTARGTFVTRRLTLTDLENAAADNLYTPFGRMLLLRALTAASRGDDVPLARLAYGAIGIDPETLLPQVDPTYSDAMYYAVECQDYAYYPDAGDEAARLDAWIDAADAAGVDRLRLGSIYFGDLPCLYWPSQPTDSARPAPLVDTPFPIFVLTATLDPATPIANAMRIFGRAENAYLFVTTGGAHVIFGRGDPCPDVPITRFLVSGRLPATRVTICEGQVSDEYVRNVRRSAAAYSSPLALMTSVDNQILNTEPYAYELAWDPITMGCDLGGTLSYVPGDVDTGLVLRRCAFIPGFPMTGRGTVDGEGGMTLDVSVPGGHLHYVRDADGTRSVTGSYRVAAAAS